MTDEFIKDRNEAFASGDLKKIKAYCKKYNIPIPEDEKVFLAGVYKATCNLFLEVDSPISIEQYTKSHDWLIKNNYSPSIIDEDERR